MSVCNFSLSRYVEHACTSGHPASGKVAAVVPAGQVGDHPGTTTLIPAAMILLQSGLQPLST
jgi:hypothetical protein